MIAPGSVTSPPPTAAGRSRTAFYPPRFALGGAPIGELPPGPAGDALAEATVNAAYGAGMRFFDTAPHYGLGLSERRLGTALAGRRRGDYLISTRVSGLVADEELRRDFSAAAVRQSLADSLARLGVETIDLVLIDEPGEQWQIALDEAYPVLHELRLKGVVGAVGAAMNHWQSLDRFLTDAELNAVVLAGQYSILDQSGAPLLARCEARGVAAIVSGVLPSDLLGPRDAGPPATGPADRIAAVCNRYGVSLPQAALAFPARHPAVKSMLLDAGSAAEVRADAALVRRPVPVELWRDPDLAALVDSHH